MHMHNRSVIKAVIALLPVFTACKVAEVGVSSPDRDLKISLLTSEGRAEIAVDFHGKGVIEPSRIGFVFSDGEWGNDVRIMEKRKEAIVEVNMARNGGFAARISPSEHSVE